MTNVEEIIKFVEYLINPQKKSLSFIQRVILRESLSEITKTYEQIALENNYSEKYIRQVVAPNLWQLISVSVGEKVTRINCRAILEQKLKYSLLDQSLDLTSSPKINLEFPEGQVPLASPLYIERVPIETICYEEIMQPGALLRIQGPRKIGKSSLLARVISHGKNQNYSTVSLNLHQAETEIFVSSRRFLRWVCANVTKQLGIEDRLNDYWDDDIGASVSCTIYFQHHLLAAIENPFIMALDGIDIIFDYPDIARNFLALLRSWYESSKDILVWKKLRLAMAHTTDLYMSLKTNQSPFNVGLIVEMPKFNKNQIQELAERHQLKVLDTEIDSLIKVTAGFPYLVRLVFYYSKHNDISIKKILQDAATDSGIFNQHLHYLLVKTQQDFQLWEAFKVVLNSPSELEAEIAIKLKNLGLVNLVGNKVYVSCELYQNYFSSCLVQ